MSADSPPQLDDFRSARLTYRNGDLFNPPALTNFLGCLQAAPDITAVQHVTFAPYSLGESWVGALTLNACALSRRADPIDFEWRPDRIIRRTSHDDFDLVSTTVMGVRRQTVAITLRITNRGSTPRPCHLRFLTGEGVIHSCDQWRTPYSPRECPAISTTPWEGEPPAHTLVRNQIVPTTAGDGLVFTSRTSQACALQVTRLAPDRISRRWLEFDGKLASGETREFHFALAIGTDEAAARESLAPWAADPAAMIAAAEEDWEEEIRAAFTPANTRYSGHLPRLHTVNDDLQAVWLNAAITAIYCKREHPESAYGRTYVTLMPRYWATTSFINDWSLSAYLLVLLDPTGVRRMVELWLARDIHRHFGTEYVSGDSTGNWYSCNDYAMARLITTYIRVTGDHAWLDQEVGDRSVLDHLQRCATHYRSLTGESGLADYGDRNSLLEAVGTYEHEVASLNAANVWILRETADLLTHRGDQAGAAALREEAAALVPQTMSLYAPGAGHWHCRQPDGARVPVRHIWDFIHTLNFLHEDLPPEQVKEMIGYFQREHLDPNWLAALSPLDEDSGFSLRPDHQWNGSYPAWVSLAASALLAADEEQLLADWWPGLARSSRQGPYAQAHFVENAAPLLAEGARKAPTEWPYINDWTCLSAGNFLETILLGLFGVEFGHAELRARPRLAKLDPHARLSGIRHQDRLFTVTANGVQPEA